MYCTYMIIRCIICNYVYSWMLVVYSCLLNVWHDSPCDMIYTCPHTSMWSDLYPPSHSNVKWFIPALTHQCEAIYTRPHTRMWSDLYPPSHTHVKWFIPALAHPSVSVEYVVSSIYNTTQYFMLTYVCEQNTRSNSVIIYCQLSVYSSIFF